MGEDDALAACTGFEWDEGNLVKNWEKYRVSALECEQVFFNRPLVTSRDTSHSAQDGRFYALEHTDAGRLLFVAFAVRNYKIQVISARDMNRKERKVYEAS